jgi:hypothetical protein
MEFYILKRSFSLGMNLCRFSSRRRNDQGTKWPGDERTGDKMTGDEIYEGTKWPGWNDRGRNERGRSVMPPANRALGKYRVSIWCDVRSPLSIQQMLKCQIKSDLFHFPCVLTPTDREEADNLALAPIVALMLLAAAYRTGLASFHQTRGREREERERERARERERERERESERERVMEWGEGRPGATLFPG